MKIDLDYQAKIFLLVMACALVTTSYSAGWLDRNDDMVCAEKVKICSYNNCNIPIFSTMPCYPRICKDVCIKWEIREMPKNETVKEPVWDANITTNRTDQFSKGCCPKDLKLDFADVWACDCKEDGNLIIWFNYTETTTTTLPEFYIKISSDASVEDVENAVKLAERLV